MLIDPDAPKPSWVQEFIGNALATLLIGLIVYLVLVILFS